MKNRKEKKEKKKEKIVYIDDGSTVCDMSGLRQTKKPFMPDIHGYNTPPKKRRKPPSRWRSIVNTYLDSVKMMLLPMLVFIGIIAIAFFFLWMIFYLKTL